MCCALSPERARGEHVLGFCEQSLHVMRSWLIGMECNAAIDLLMALLHVLCRCEQLLWIHTKKK